MKTGVISDKKRSVIELTEQDLETIMDRVAGNAANSVSDKIIREGVEKAVTNIFIKFGFNMDNPSEMQRDMAFLRDLRIGTSTIKKSALYILLTVTIPAIAYTIWQGIKAAIK